MKEISTKWHGRGITEVYWRIIHRRIAYASRYKLFDLGFPYISFFIGVEIISSISSPFLFDTIIFSILDVVFLVFSREYVQ